MRFSNKTKCFYPKDIYYSQLPDDLIDVSPEEYHAAMSREPGDNLEVVDGRVVIIPKPPKTKEEIAEEIWQKIKTVRDKRKTRGVKVRQKWFHSDDSSRIQILGLVMMGNSMAAGLKWKTMDGSFVSMTPDLAADIFSSQATSDHQIFSVAEQKRAELFASDDPENYDIESGWPKSFGE